MSERNLMDILNEAHQRHAEVSQMIIRDLTQHNCFDPACHTCNAEEAKLRTEKQKRDVAANERYLDSLVGR